MNLWYTDLWDNRLQESGFFLFLLFLSFETCYFKYKETVSAVFPSCEEYFCCLFREFVPTARILLTGVCRSWLKLLWRKSHRRLEMSWGGLSGARVRITSARLKNVLLLCHKRMELLAGADKSCRQWAIVLGTLRGAREMAAWIGTLSSIVYLCLSVLACNLMCRDYVFFCPVH